MNQIKLNIKFILFWALLLFKTNGLLSQINPPNGLIYQALARDPKGNLASKRTIYVKTAILKSAPTGTAVYADEHKISSNNDGLFSFVVGQGTNKSGSYNNVADIPWGQDKYYFNLQLCIAPTLPRNGWTPTYIDMGTTQFWSVPYALFSGSTSDTLSIIVTGNQRKIYLGNKKSISFSIEDGDTSSNNEIQQLSINNGKIQLSLGGGTILLPDTSSTNEIQTISRSGNIVNLSKNGGGIYLPLNDTSATNEIQTFSRTGNTLF